MVNPVPVGIVLLLMVLALVAMLLAWRRRSRAQRGLTLPPVPADLGAVVTTAAGLHVATTFADRPLERVVAGGLGFRATATLTVTVGGVLVERAGGAPFFLPRASLEAGTASWTLDRGVERDGLTVLAWALVGPDGEPVPVESSFRFAPDTQQALLAALPVLAHHPEVPGADS